MDPCWCHNGLHNSVGGYGEDPDHAKDGVLMRLLGSNILDYAGDGLRNFVGGFCGTFASHIAAMAQKVKDCSPRKLAESPKFPYTLPSDLGPCCLKPESGFQLLGELCNLRGSAKFKKPADNYKQDVTMEVCLQQCETKCETLELDFNRPHPWQVRHTGLVPHWASPRSSRR